MKLTNAPKLVVTFVASVTLAAACSSDGETTSPGDGDGDMSGDGDGDMSGNGDGDMPGDGDGDMPGDGDGDMPGDGDMGGASMGGDTGMGGDVIIEPDPDPEPSRELCGIVDGTVDTMICADVPEACGDLEQYDGAHYFDAPGRNSEPSPDSEGGQIFFFFDGSDYINSYDVGNCYVGGEGNDNFNISSEQGQTDTYIGGPGADFFDFTSDEGVAKRIADYTPGEDELDFDRGAGVFNIGAGEASDPVTYLAIVPDFDGTNAQVPNEGTRIIYDPNSGNLWSDRDGDGAGDDPRHIAVFLNADSITISTNDFPYFDDPR